MVPNHQEHARLGSFLQCLLQLFYHLLLLSTVQGDESSVSIHIFYLPDSLSYHRIGNHIILLAYERSSTQIVID